MATLAADRSVPMARDERLFLNMALGMAAVIVAGFSVQLAMGRSTFASPLLVHAHAVVFMGWVVLFVLQATFATTGRMALHRVLGWLATGWMAAMLVLGTAVTVAMVRRGQTPFFFRPQQFLVFDPATLVTFVGLTGAAIALRRRTDWHRRLHVCGMAMLLEPGIGRLLPMPLLVPLAWEATLAGSLIVPAIGMVIDWRRSGRVHPAWAFGIGAMALCLVVVEAVTFSPVGSAIYRAVAKGSPGATVAPLDFPPKPAGSLRTGRG